MTLGDGPCERLTWGFAIPNPASVLTGDRADGMFGQAGAAGGAAPPRPVADGCNETGASNDAQKERGPTAPPVGGPGPLSWGSERGRPRTAYALLQARPPLRPVSGLDGSSNLVSRGAAGKSPGAAAAWIDRRSSRRPLGCVGRVRGSGCASSVAPHVGSVRTDLTGRSAGRVCRMGSSAVRSLRRGNIAVRSLHRGNIAVRSLHRGNLARPCRPAPRLAGTAPTAAGGRRDLGSLVHAR